MGNITYYISLIIRTIDFKIMIQKTIREISDAWRENKRPYVKQSTLAAYMLILENHILPKFGESNELHENDVQGFVLEKLEGGLSVKSVKDILIVLKMVMKFGVKNEWMNYYEWDIKYPTDVAGKKLEVLSVANHKKILNYIQSHFSFPGLGIYISLSTGLRIGEICAAENADLLTTVLRNEWGFRGTVITDCILQLSYINIDRAIAAGNDLILSLMNMQAPSEAVTNSPAGHQVLRTATHNILYTSANSIGQEVSAIPVAVVDAGLIALCVFYFVRRRKNVKRWKEQNSVQA